MALHHLATLLDIAAGEILQLGCKFEAQPERDHFRSLEAPDAVAMHSACRRDRRGVVVRKRLI